MNAPEPTLIQTPIFDGLFAVADQTQKALVLECVTTDAELDPSRWQHDALGTPAEVVWLALASCSSCGSSDTELVETPTGSLWCTDCRDTAAADTSNVLPFRN